MSFHNFKNLKNVRGFTLVEALVGSAIFLVISVAAYQAYASLFQLAAVDQNKVLAIELANEQFEIIRNLSYSNVGIPNDIPKGVVPEVQTLTRGNMTFTVTTIIRNISVSFSSSTATSTASTSPAEKLAQVTVACITCKNFSPIVLTTQIAPKNIVTDTTDGALTIKAFDANGNPIQGASVVATDAQFTPSVVVNDTTNDSGVLNIVGAATGTNAYQITVTKSGYSTDQTYPPGGSGNPSPTKPNATVAAEQVTSVSFSIDRLSTFVISGLNSSCLAAPNVGFTLVSAKTIGPGVPKYAATTTTGGTGTITLSNMEWGTYTFAPNSSSYDLGGLNILNPITVNPSSTQNVILDFVPKNSNTLLVSVADKSTSLPLSGATVTLSKSGYSSTQTTGQGYFDQTDWSGGSTASTTVFSSTTSSKYLYTDGNINTSNPAGDINLRKSGSNYVSSGVLQSEVFDTGTASNFTNLIWSPSSQPVGSGANSVRFQIAASPTNTSTTTWNYTGPDGTSGTYYTVSNTPISATADGAEYLRYEAFLNTASATNTPDLSDIAFTYTTACTPPGQVLFQGLSSGAYTLTVSNSGYTTASSSVTVSSAWMGQTVNLGQ